MEKNELKLELLKKIINCNDIATLKRVEEIFFEFSMVNEGGEKYLKEVDPVPKSHYQKLEEEHKNFKSGEIKGISWKDFRKEIKSNHGF